MGRPLGKSGKTREERIEQMKKFKADEPEQPTKTTKEAKASSPTIESDALSAPFELVDPEWAITSVVDPKTGIHISQWRQMELKKHDANAR